MSQPAPDTPQFTPPVAQPGPAPAAHEQRANLRRTIPAVVLAVLFFAVGINLGGLRRSTEGRFDLFGHVVTLHAGWVVVIVALLTVLFVIAGVTATRAVGRELGRVGTAKGGLPVGSAIRLTCSIVGYLTIGFAVLALLQVNVGSLLVGGAVTGVVIGIAAQQTLGNFFAGLVLLFARPYVPGQRVWIRSGAMGGPFIGVIVSTGLVYTLIETADGPINMPNAGVLGSAIGPASPEAGITDPAEPL